MKSSPYTSGLGFGLGIWFMVALLLVFSRTFPAAGWATLPLIWPAALLLGDEAQERYEVWGEIGLLWVGSLPMSLLLAAALRSFTNSITRRGGHSL